MDRTLNYTTDKNVHITFCRGSLGARSWVWEQKLHLPVSNGEEIVRVGVNTLSFATSMKLSNVEPSQYLDGRPPGNTGC